MGMSGNHQPRARIKQRGHIGNVMHQQGLPTVEVETQVINDEFCPRGRLVVIPAHDIQRRNRRQLFKDLRFTNVARMNNPFTTLQRREGFGAQQAVGIGDHANFHARLQARFNIERLSLRRIPRIIMAINVFKPQRPRAVNL
ncbi:hypothetical protein D3C71_1275650 [compost metagenome]